MQKMHEKCTTPLNLVIGEEEKLHEVLNMVELSLVSHFQGHFLGVKVVKEWLLVDMDPLLGHYPYLLVLSRGWLGLMFRSIKDTK